MALLSEYFNTRGEGRGRAYFVGANTPRGFESDYGNLLSEDDCRKVYIIKGGSGTGKSTMMRRAAKSAENTGASCTWLLCGSDPDSLDGVILEKDGVRIAVIDGTAPHIADPVYAGACGEIINCGDCWDSAYLEGRRDSITDIMKQKKYCFEVAYRFLRGAKEVIETIKPYEGQVLLDKKLSACTSRIVSGFRPHACGCGKVIPRRTLAVSMKGAVRLDTFERAKYLIGVADYKELLPAFMKSVADELTWRGCDTEVSYSPVYGIAEIYVPSLKLAFVPAREGIEYYKKINMRRFADTEALRDVRQKLRFASKCLDAMMNGAMESLDAARKLHFELEEVYKGAMDFSAVDALGVSLQDKVLSHFDK